MTTMLRMKGRLYDLEDTFSNPPLNVVIYMQGRLKVRMRDIVGTMQRMNLAMSKARAELGLEDGDESEEAKAAEAEAMLDVIYDDDAMRAFLGLIWLARTVGRERAADGGFLTLEDAADGIGMRDLEFVNDEDDDPFTELDLVEAVTAAPRSSTTSSGTSTSTS